MQADHDINTESLVVELASNDGYLLQHFAKAGIPVLDIEPTANTAEAAEEKGIETEVAFFGVETAGRVRRQKGSADLVNGNNLLAHVPEIRDFADGMKRLLADAGIITLEFPHLLKLIEKNQFDTISHEHFSYLSLLTIQKILAHYKLSIFDVAEIGTHGGSLRICACHHKDDKTKVSQRVHDPIQREIDFRLSSLAFYDTFAERVYRTKRDILGFLIGAKKPANRSRGMACPVKAIRY